MTTPLHTSHSVIDLHTATTTDGGSWVHLVPSGVFRGRDGRGPFEARDLASIITNSETYARQQPLPIDYNHAIDLAAPKGGPSPAAGWITSLQARADGIWGLVKWTGKAAAEIAAGHYRFISPVIMTDPAGVITGVIRAALTNDPNLPQLKALFSTSTDPQNMDPNDTGQFLTELRKALGLATDADNATILAKVAELSTSLQSAQPDPTRYVPFAEFEKVLSERNALSQGVSLQAAQQHVAAQINSANMPGYLRDWGVALCSVNKPAFDAFIERTKGFFNRLTQPMASAMPPGNRSGSILDDTERDVCFRMGLTPEEFAASKSFIESAKA